MSKLSDLKYEDLSKEKDLKKEKIDDSVNEKKIQEKYDEYKDMSQKDLSEELFKEVSRQKSKGTFNYNALSSMVENLRPSLTQEQYQNMKRILESLK